MTQIDLKEVAGNEVRVLIGHDRGVAARKMFHLDELDTAREAVVVRVPKSLRTLTPSFVQGFFSGSVQRLGEDGFFKHYRFEAPTGILGDIRAGVDRVLTSRHIAGV